MAERSSSRKPQSLNDRHYRFLQDLSAPPKPSSKPSDVNNEEVPNELVKTEGKRNDNDAPHFSICDSSPEQEKVEKPIKVKVEGRRRLCKISSRADTDNAKKMAVIEEPDFSDVVDFESPLPQPKNASSSDGGNEIRDILNDLSSKLEFLSIEKRKSTKKIELLEDEDQKGLVTRKESGGEKKVDMPDYLSADSSFSPSPDLSDASSDINKNTRYGVENVVEQYKEEGDIYSESEGDNICRNGTRKACERSVSEVKDEEDGYLQTQYKGDNLPSRVYETKKSDGNKISKVSQVGKKSITLEKYSQTKAEESYDDEEEDDCVVLSGKKLVKGVAAVNSNPNHYSVSSQVIDLDDFSSDSPLEDKSTITLRGPKYNYKLPGKIAKMLYPHQRDGLRWLWSLHCQGKGGILGDDMGLGKTMQICSFLAGLFHSRLIKRAMVVAPKTLLSHWIKELSVVGLSEKIREYYGTCVKTRQYELQYILQDKGILLTTYDIVRNNSKSLRGGHYFNDEDRDDDVTWDYMILDEGHLIKNPTTQRAKSLLEIPSAHRIIISGTPIQNNLKELWALFNFSCPELLGDKKWFKETFENAILRGNEKNATDREKRIGSEVAKELRERIKPYFLRRLKNEVFNDDADQTNAKLSKKSEIIVWLKLTSVQRQLYEAFLKSELVLSAFDGSPLAALTILKKICDHPLLLTKRAAEDVLEGMDSMLQPEDVHVAEKLAMHIADVAEGEDFEEKHDNVSCKISFILSLLDELIPKRHNVLIFSQTRKMLNLIQESLLSNGYGFLRIDGTTKASDRVKIVSDFQDGIGAPIFLLTSQVGGLGLTLTRADRVIVVDPAWNPSTDNQSVDRAYRIGQTKNVIVYRLMTCGTVEEKIYRKQIYKGGLFKTATEQKEQIRYFSQQDLRELFSLPSQGFDVSVTQKQLHEEHDSQIKLNEFLKGHIQFLENQGIAGVSHHSLLFSKTAPPVQVLPEEEEVFRKKGTTYIGSSSSAVVERSVNGAEYAINPKNVKLNQKSSTPDSVGKLTESQIKERINRLSQTLTNQAMVSRLPDRGEKIRKQIAELKVELCEMEKGKENEPIDLDDISGKLERVLNV